MLPAVVQDHKTKAAFRRGGECKLLHLFWWQRAHNFNQIISEKVSLVRRQKTKLFLKMYQMNACTSDRQLSAPNVSTLILLYGFIGGDQLGAQQVMHKMKCETVDNSLSCCIRT